MTVATLNPRLPPSQVRSCRETVRQSAVAPIPLAATLFLTAMVLGTVPIGLMRGIGIYESTANYNYEMMYPPPGLSAVRAGMLCLCVLLAVFCIYRLGANALRARQTFAAKAIFGTLLLWWGAEVAINIARMPSDAINPKNWYLPLLVGALYCVSTLPYDSVVTTIRRPMWVLMVLTLAVACVAPFRVFAPTPGVFGYRLHGFFCHANALAMFVACYALMPPGPRSPAVWVWLRNGVAIVLLLLTVCKTVLVLSLGSLAAVAFVRVSSAPTLRPLRLLVAIVCVAMALTFYLNKKALVYTVADHANVDAGGLENMSSRTLLWEMMLADWQTRPLLGFGPSAWKEERENYVVEGQLLPHAHNQYVQTLWETGLVGMPLLLVHLAAVILVGLVSFRNKDFAFVPLLVIVLGRTFTEVPLQPFGFDVPWCVYLLLFAMLAAAHRETALTGEEVETSWTRTARLRAARELRLLTGCAVAGLK
jgi:O-antigen ligase